jgi:hypothetical protein
MVVLFFLVGGCAWGPGDPFAILEPSFTARYVLRADREVAGAPGWQKLSSDYQVRITAARVRLTDMALLGSAGGGGGGGGRFDPAKPPPGYTLCHNGHCHSEDGRLVPYAQVEAELAGGGAGASALATLVTLPVAGDWDLLAPAARVLECRPGCALDEAHLVRASAPVLALDLEGLVRDGRAPPRLAGEVRLVVRLAAAAGAGAGAGAVGAAALPSAEGELDLPVDRNHPPRVALGLALEIGAAAFDGIDLGAAAITDGAIDLGDDRNQAARARLLKNLLEAKLLDVQVSRTDP